MDYAVVRNRLKHFGPAGLARMLAHDVMNHLMYVEVLHVMELTLEDVDPLWLTLELPYESRFLDAAEVESFAARPEAKLAAPWVDEALERGDRCFALLDGEVLASYGWYSRKPTRITGEFQVKFNPRAAYMHHGFTQPSYRGQRLHAIGMGRALEALSDEGTAGLVSVVASNNLASLKSTQRLGYRPFGKITIVGRLNSYFVHVDRGCRAEGFSVEPAREGFRSIGSPTLSFLTLRS